MGTTRKAAREQGWANNRTPVSGVSAPDGARRLADPGDGDLVLGCIREGYAIAVNVRAMLGHKDRCACEVCYHLNTATSYLAGAACAYRDRPEIDPNV